MQITLLLKLERKSYHIGILRFDTVVCLDGLMYAVTIVSITFATLTAYSYRVGEIRRNMRWASWYFYSLIHEVSICTNILGQSIFGKKQLAIDILRKEQKKELNVIGPYKHIGNGNIQINSLIFFITNSTGGFLSPIHQYQLNISTLNHIKTKGTVSPFYS